jgi:hypothetical protein
VVIASFWDAILRVHQTPVGRVPMFDMNLSALRLTNGGRLIAVLAELHTIPQPDLEPTYWILTRERGSSESGGASWPKSHNP